MEHDLSIGERIRYYRRRLGISQEVCANLVGRSESWLSQVERGVLLIDRVSVLLNLAHVLKVELIDLLGPALKLPPNGGGPGNLPQGMPAVRRAIMRPDGLGGTVEVERFDAVELTRRVEAANQAVTTYGRYTQVALMLPDLIGICRAAAQTFEGRDQEVAWGLLAQTYQLASVLSRKLGDAALAWIAADRACSAAERSGDEALVGSSIGRLIAALMLAGQMDDAEALASERVSRLGRGLDTAGPEWVSTWGAFMLAAAICAARRDDPVSCHGRLREASAAARLLPDGYVDRWTLFCVTNVALHEVHAAYDAGDPVEALRLADQVDFDAMPSLQRRARTWIDVARAHGLRRNDAAAVATLLVAEQAGPEEVRYHGAVHDLVQVLLRRERKSATPGLRALAQRIRVE